MGCHHFPSNIAITGRSNSPFSSSPPLDVVGYTSPYLPIEYPTIIPWNHYDGQNMSKSHFLDLEILWNLYIWCFNQLNPYLWWLLSYTSKLWCKKIPDDPLKSRNFSGFQRTSPWKYRVFFFRHFPSQGFPEKWDNDVRPWSLIILIQFNGSHRTRCLHNGPHDQFDAWLHSFMNYGHHMPSIFR